MSQNAGETAASTLTQTCRRLRCPSAWAPSYGLLTAREAHEWFLLMMRSHEEFVVETDRAGEASLPFWSETVRQVMVE